MKRMIGLSVATAFLLAAVVGCGQGNRDNQGQAKNGDKKVAGNDGGNTVATKPERQKIATRDDWRNVPKEEGPAPVQKLDAKEYEGVLKGVEPDRNVVTVEVRGQQFTLRVSPSAFIEESSTRSYALKGGLSALGAGNHVFIQTVKEGDQDVIQRIKLLARN